MTPLAPPNRAKGPRLVRKGTPSIPQRSIRPGDIGFPGGIQMATHRPWSDCRT